MFKYVYKIFYSHTSREQEETIRTMESGLQPLYCDLLYKENYHVIILNSIDVTEMYVSL